MASDGKAKAEDHRYLKREQTDIRYQFIGRFIPDRQTALFVAVDVRILAHNEDEAEMLLENWASEHLPNMRLDSVA